MIVIAIYSPKNCPLTKEDLFNALDNLLSKDQSEKLNINIILHGLIWGKFDQNKECLISNTDKIITTFKTVSHQLGIIH